MDMIFRSVVGKLWMTIIALFAFVLTLFSLLLVQSFDSFYFRKQMEGLKMLTEQLSLNLQHSTNTELYIESASAMGKAYHTRMFLIDHNKKLIASTDSDTNLPDISLEQLLNNPALRTDQALLGQHPDPERIIVPVTGAQKERVQVLAVVVPHPLSSGKSGAVIMYQAIEDYDGTVADVRNLIFVVGVIGFIMTTVFAFFLSSRITYPLRHMKETAHRIAEGDIHAAIPIRTNDEIGELASSFNTMASKLNNLVKALSNEKEQLSSVLHSMVDGVIMIDVNGQIVVTNPPAEHFLRDWKYESEIVPMHELYQQVVRFGHEVSADIPVQGHIWSVVMAPLYHDHDQIRGAVAVLRDVTKERKMDKLRKDFVANVSHELRTPLSMLQGYSEAIVDDIASTPEEHKELAQIIYDESVRMTKLVNELLDLARMEAGHVELHQETIRLKPYIERIYRKFTNVGRERGVQIQLEIDTSMEMFDLDPDRIEQVLTNLIDNALRHTPQAGVVRISIRGDDDLVLEVSDTGSGIPEEDLPFIFERFYKADKARTRGRAGTGLGLAIAKNIVEAHNGTINVQSKRGEGTTFTIHLPR
ncbi:MAG: ATP-binding protein [Clostridia bacterium]